MSFIAKELEQVKLQPVEVEVEVTKDSVIYLASAITIAGLVIVLVNHLLRKIL